MKTNLYAAAIAAAWFLALASVATADDKIRPQLGRIRTMDEVDRTKFDDYQDRLRERRAEALERRAEIAASRPPARGWTAVVVPLDVQNPAGVGIAIERGWVTQPPIHRRGRYVDTWLERLAESIERLSRPDRYYP